MMHTTQITQTEKPIEASHRASEGQSLPDDTGFSGLLASMFSVQATPEASAENSHVVPSSSERTFMEGTLPLEFTDHADSASRIDAALSSENSLSVEEVMAQISSLQNVPESYGNTVSGMTSTDTGRDTDIEVLDIDVPKVNSSVQDNVAMLEIGTPSLGISGVAPNSLDVQNVAELSDVVDEQLNSTSLVTNSIEKNGVYSETEIETKVLVPMTDSEIELDENHLNSLISPLSEDIPPSSFGTSFDMNELGTKPVTQSNVISPEQLESIPTVNEQNLVNGEALVEQNAVMASSVAQAQAASSSGISTAGSQVAAQFNHSSASAGNQGGGQSASQGVTHWGSQSTDGQAAQSSGQQGQSFGQSGQNSSGQQTHQQAMMFAQANQENRQQSIEQQVAAKAINDAMAKSEVKELLGGAEIASSDRRGVLPIGLQTINQPVKHPQWGQALGQRVVFMANNNLQQAQITLNPQKLGQIQVTLQLDKDQQMHVSLTAQNGTTRESIENALPRLREMMEQAGVSLGSVDVREQKQFSEDASNHSGDNKKSSDSHLLEDSSVDESPLETVISTDNIVDYYA